MNSPIVSRPGDDHYRARVGFPNLWDQIGACTFSALTILGLREHHRLLDIGCGSLRYGRLCLLYLNEGGYFGIEPEERLVYEGMQYEVGEELFRRKKPRFDHNARFDLTVFHEQFHFIVAQSIFTHASLFQIGQCMSQVKKVLLPQGLFLFNFQLGKQDSTCNEWTYHQCVSYTQKTIQQIIQENNLVLRWMEFPLPVRRKWIVAAHSQEVLKRLNHHVSWNPEKV